MLGPVRASEVKDPMRPQTTRIPRTTTLPDEGHIIFSVAPRAVTAAADTFQPHPAGQGKWSSSGGRHVLVEGERIMFN